MSLFYLLQVLTIDMHSPMCIAWTGFSSCVIEVNLELGLVLFLLVRIIRLDELIIVGYCIPVLLFLELNKSYFSRILSLLLPLWETIPSP